MSKGNSDMSEEGSRLLKRSDGDARTSSAKEIGR